MGKSYWINQIKVVCMRAIKSSAQTLLALISASAIINDMNWLRIILASVWAGIMSILTYIANLPDSKCTGTEK